MNRKVTYSIAASAVAAAILVAVVAMSYQGPAASIKVLSINNVTNVNNPSISVNPETGIAYAAFAREAGGFTNIYLMSSNDGGKTFTDPVLVNDTPGDASYMWNTIPVKFGPDGKIYVAWMNTEEHPDFPWGITELRLASSNDGGKTFSPAVNPVAGEPSEKAFFDLAVSDSGTLYLSYLDSQTNQVVEVIARPSSYKMVKSTDGGRTFSEPVVLDNQNCVCCQTASTMGPDGEVYFAWRDLQYESDVKTTNTADNPYNWGNANGTLLEGEDPVSYETIRDIVVMHTTDGADGKTFSTQSKVSDDKWYINGCPDAGPGIAFDSKGRLHVAWFTGSETALNGQGFYYTHSDDRGQNFATPVPIHLLSEQWIPPTTQYLVVDGNDNSWIFFVNSEGLKKGADYAETYAYDGKGTVHLAVVDRDGNVLRNGAFATGDITKHYPFASGNGENVVMSWMDGEDVKIAVFDTAI